MVAQPPRASAATVKRNKTRRDMTCLRDGPLQLFDHTGRPKMTYAPGEFPDSFRRRFGNGVAQAQIFDGKFPESSRPTGQCCGRTRIEIARTFRVAAHDAATRQPMLQAQLCEDRKSVV